MARQARNKSTGAPAATESPEITIETGVPIPPRRNARTSYYEDVLLSEELEPGDSFVAKQGIYRIIRNLRLQHRTAGRSWITRVEDKEAGTVRVWRTEDAEDAAEAA